jgi:hypothetical protein
MQWLDLPYRPIRGEPRQETLKSESKKNIKKVGSSERKCFVYIGCLLAVDGGADYILRKKAVVDNFKWWSPDSKGFRG